MINATHERTLKSCIIPPGPTHIDGCFSMTFRSLKNLVSFSGFSFSLLYDFFVKTTRKTNFRNEIACLLPIINNSNNFITCRTLSLNCLSSLYENLWYESFNPSFTIDRWAKNEPRLNNNYFKNLTSKWIRNCALRTEYERRQALIEIDVLVAMSFHLTLEELKDVYRQIFYGLKNIEKNTYYDQKGCIVFTTRKGFSEIGFPRKSSKINQVGWEDIKDIKSGTVERTIIDDTQPGGPIERTITYEAPFDRCDREKDYEIVWTEFERRFKDQECKS